jgi:hypothetical protein
MCVCFTAATSPLQGEPRCVAQAIYVVTAAVDRYKELCEGRYSGESAVPANIWFCIKLAAACAVVPHGFWCNKDL